MGNIFYGEREQRDFNNSKKYAFMNWRFDNGEGCNDKNDNRQVIHDNYQLGKGYLGNALIRLNVLIENNNQNDIADILIFPIMFSVWHGLELWLKSSIRAVGIFFDKEVEKNNHTIYVYYDKLKSELKNANLNFVLNESLQYVGMIISELKRVNANFDFARYSFNSKNEYQFYNAPLNNDKQWQKDSNEKLNNIVPNTCVDIIALFELLIKVYDSFGTFVECLTYILENNEKLTDAGYKYYLNSINRTRELLDSQHETIMQTLLREIS